MRRTLLCTAAMIAGAAPVFGQTPEGFDLDPIIVSGGLFPVAEGAYGRAVSVVTAEEIERRQIRYVADALRALPGVSVSGTGSSGAGPLQVRIRGAEGNHTLVLIDGVDVTAPENGEFDFGGLLAADIERIEILRGPQSSLFGANAIGGVVSITTKRATEPGNSGGFGAELGSNGSWGGNVALRWWGETARLSFSAAHRFDGGFNIAGDDGADDTGETTTFNVSGDADLGDIFGAGFALRRSLLSNDYDRFNYGAPDRAGLVTDADLVRDRQELFGTIYGSADLMGGRFENELRYNFLNLDDQNSEDRVQSTDTTSKRRTLRYRGTFALDAGSVAAANQTLTLAVERETESFKNNDASLVFDPSQLDEQERTLTGYVLEYRGRFDIGLDLQASVRFDDNDAFDDATTWTLGASYALPNGTTRLHASAGTGVQNPTLFDQFGFIPDQFVGNPDLKPEKSTGWDIGVEQRFWNGRGVIDVTYFNERLKDEIAVTFEPPLFYGSPVNEDGTSKRQGVEITSRVDFNAQWALGLNYTYLDAKDPDGTPETRRPMHDLGLDLYWTSASGRTDVTVGAQYVAGLTDFDFTAPAVADSVPDKIDLEDHMLVNVALAHRITDRVALEARVSNLFDEQYEEVYGYATQGLTAYAGLRATW
ncbi:MAG: TonB-dependent receptor [Rhodobacteraceae bacterium]|jgi:vitamin B12 transporter|nr:TonB-dependent receptor [Paracoccaceae bacterium]